MAPVAIRAAQALLPSRAVLHPRPVPAGPAAISVVVPAFNEEQRLSGGLDAILRHLVNRGDSFEIIVVDDGSSDGTRLLAERHARWDGRIRVRTLARNQGKGAAVAEGIRIACGDWILVTDVDLSTPIEELDHLQACGAGADVLIGSRGLPDSRLHVRQPAMREGLGRVFNKLVRLVALPGLYDTQCGFKLWSRSAARAVFRDLRTARFAFDVEALWLSKRRGFRIREIPVRWTHDPRSTVRLRRDGLRMACDLILLLLRRVLGD